MHVCDTWSSPERNLSNQFWHCRSFKPFFNFLWACDAFFLCENKKAKYDVPFDFPFFNERQTKTTQPIKKLFLLIDSWIANYQITKCVLHLDYASKSKNSTEAIYEWNPQLLCCQPNNCIGKNRGFDCWEEEGGRGHASGLEKQRRVPSFILNRFVKRIVIPPKRARRDEPTL